LTFGEYLDSCEAEARKEARIGKEYSGKTWHGYYAYHKEIDLKKANSDLRKDSL